MINFGAIMDLVVNDTGVIEEMFEEDLVGVLTDFMNSAKHPKTVESFVRFLEVELGLWEIEYSGKLMRESIREKGLWPEDEPFEYEDDDE